MRPSRISLLILIGGLFFIAAALIGNMVLDRPGVPVDRPKATGKALIGGPFSLVDQDGKRRTNREFRGKYLWVFFGFTNCPDVCPTTLQTMTEALEEIGDLAKRVQPVMISIDPDRDTKAQLKKYYDAFEGKILMLTGTAAEIAAAAKVYRISYSKRPPGKDGRYNMSHTSLSFLMGPSGDYVAHFPHNLKPEALASELRRYIK